MINKGRGLEAGDEASPLLGPFAFRVHTDTRSYIHTQVVSKYSTLYYVSRCEHAVSRRGGAG